jgi:small subunit ribosomal protein S17
VIEEQEDQTPVEEPQADAPADDEATGPEATEDEAPAAEEAPAEAPAAQEAAAAEEPAAEDAPAAEEPAAAEAPAAEEAPAEEAGAAQAAAPSAPAEDVEPEEALHPKQRRKLARSQHTGEAHPPRTPEERASERSEERRRRSVARRAYRQKRREKDTASPRAGASQPEPKEHGPGRPRVRQGVVVSAKPDKTITVRIDVARRHRTYKKIVRSSSTLHAHDERNEAHEGDTVRVIESRPLSRTKRWRLVEILERAR